MFSEILKIIPRFEGRDLDRMEKTLNSRFTRVAKKFGGGLVSILKGGGIAGIAIGLIDKLLNPLQEVQASIDKSLNAGNDLATYAKQFSTTAGNLARLQAFGQATGLDPEGVRMLLGKFQGKVAEATADPSTTTAVSKFVGRKDIAEAFFEFIQSMQSLTDVQKNLVQQEVFGEKQILKSSEFLNTDFKKMDQMFNAMGAPSSDALTRSAEWLGQMKDNLDLSTAARGLRDLPAKAGRINDSTINGMNYAADLELARENKRLNKVSDLQKMSIAMDKMLMLIEDAYMKLTPLIGTYLPMVIDQLTSGAKAVEKSRAIRGMLPGKEN